MKGFDPRWQDETDFILGITKEIWEDRGIATLHHYYADGLAVRSPASVVVGNQGVIAATMATLAEFPDRTLLGEDVIWCGDGADGFLSSHRLLSTATHLHEGVYGAPTGRKLHYRIIADCACRANQVYDEWLVRDQGAIMRQLGVEPKRYAADLIAREGGPERCVRPLTQANDAPPRYTGRGNDDPAGAEHAGLLGAIMGTDMAAIPRAYDRAVQLDLPGGITGHGWEAADRFWMNLRAAFPSATFTLQHTIGRSADPRMPPRSALRWTLVGRHDGYGMFGPPTRQQVYILGMSHAELGPRGIRREFVLFDETAVWKQILLGTG